MRKSSEQLINNQRISQDYKDLEKRSDYDVVIIGSGYGGSITASRLARAGQSVCVLERGLELRPGQYPNNLSDAMEHSQVRTDTEKGIVSGKPTALFDLRVNEDVSTLVGCGLGGTSLINANVSLQLNEASFARDKLEWPSEFRQNTKLLEPYYRMARDGLGANPYPQCDDKQAPGYRPLNKLLALEKSGQKIGIEVKRPDINVTFNQDQLNHFGFKQAQCNLCGDCCSGCNVGAKNTTLMNYLPDAQRHGAELFCNSSVDYIERSNKGWKVHIEPTDRNNAGLRKHKTIKAKIVIIAAGTLGSNEIMLRSKAKGLSTSDKLGQHFSGNGDLLAFGYNSYWKDNNEFGSASLRASDAPRYEGVYGVGQGEQELEEQKRPGPCITGVIDLRDESRPLGEQLVIQEGVVPGAIATVFLGGLVFGAARNANFLRYGAEQAESRLRDIESLATTVQNDTDALNELAFAGPISRTQTYLVMSMDDSQGKLKLNDDSVIIDWPNAGKSSIFNHHHTTLAQVNDAVQGQLIKNPISDSAFGNKLITVHPLGGCRMADDHLQGVVNHKGQVFDCEQANSVHDGLYICDGSIIPGALGVNPLLTISALAERCAELIAKDHDWAINYKVNALDNAPVELAVSKQINQNATERMHVLDEASDNISAQSELEVMRNANTTETSADVEQERRFRRWLKTEVKALLKPNSKPFRAGLEFTEVMRGYVGQSSYHHAKAKRSNRDYQTAAAFGESQGNKLVLEMTIQVPELRQLSKDRNYVCSIKSGYVTLANHRARIRSGQFQMLIEDKSSVETWLMLYQLEFKDEDGNLLVLNGTKTFHHTEESHWWTDLTRLHVDIHRAKSNSANSKDEVYSYSGVAELDLQGLIKMVSTLKTYLGNGVLKKLLGTRVQIVAAALGRESKIKDSVVLYHMANLAMSLGETVFRSYGGLLSTLNNFPKLDLANLQTRPHLTPDYESLVPTKDGKTIKLTRYSLNTHAAKPLPPVILANGMGVKASSFVTPTVDCNLVEYLCQRGREVWLFDYRASEDSASSHLPFTIDDIVEYDWPAAIENIRAHSSAPQVQIVAHCVGSMSLLMSLLKGSVDKNCITSIVSSQLALHPISNWLNNAKSDLDLVAQFKRIPLINELNNVVTMDAGTTDFDRTFDVMANQIPTPHGEQCNNPACHRVLAIYGPSYLHAQLNHDTHLKIADWFGQINLEPFEQMARAIKAGHVVDALGENSYLANIARTAAGATHNNVPQLDVPITFMAGALNQEFLPQSTARTYEWLRAHNPLGAEQYQRHVFEDYGHMDCFVGKNASVDIFPYIHNWLEETL